MKFTKTLLCLIASIYIPSSFAKDYFCNKNTVATTNQEGRFIVNGDEVTDTKTNLIWKTCAVGKEWDGTTCSGVASDYPWKTALLIATQSEEGYRLPNVKELQSIFEYQCSYPAVNINIFKGLDAEAGYWTSTPFSADEAYRISSNGYVSYKDMNTRYLVLPVKSGPKQ